MESCDVFGQIDAGIARADDGRRLRRWCLRWPVLAAQPIESLSDLPDWVRGLPRRDADDVLRALVTEAQGGDEVATLVVISCLRPGLLRLVRSMGLPPAEAVSHAADRILRLPLSRRSIAGGLILDVRHAAWAEWRTRKAEEPTQPDRILRMADSDGQGDTEVELSPTKQLSEIISSAWRRGVLKATDANMITETRLLGLSLEDAAARRSISLAAAYSRRSRAERRLRQAYGPASKAPGAESVAVAELP
jgi:hypothetical protein